MGFRKCSETRGFHCSEQAGRCSWRFEASDDDRTTWCLPPQLSGSEDLRKPSETRTNRVWDRQIVRVSDRVFRLTILPSGTLAADSLETTHAPACPRSHSLAALGIGHDADASAWPGCNLLFHNSQSLKWCSHGMRRENTCLVGPGFR